MAGDSTHSAVLPLDDKARIEELARMLGGERISDTTLAHAQEMLNAPAAAPATPPRGTRKARA